MGNFWNWDYIIVLLEKKLILLQPYSLWDVLFYRGFSLLMGNLFWPLTQWTSQRRRKHWGPCSWGCLCSQELRALNLHLHCVPVFLLFPQFSLRVLGGLLHVMPSLSIPAHQDPCPEWGWKESFLASPFLGRVVSLRAYGEYAENRKLRLGKVRWDWEGTPNSR